MLQNNPPEKALKFCAKAFWLTNVLLLIITTIIAKVLFKSELKVLAEIMLLGFIITITILTLKAYWTGLVIFVMYLLYYSLAVYVGIYSVYLFLGIKEFWNATLIATMVVTLVVHIGFGYKIVVLILFNKNVKQYMKEMRTVRKEKRKNKKAQTLPEKPDLQ